MAKSNGHRKEVRLDDEQVEALEELAGERETTVGQALMLVVEDGLALEFPDKFESRFEPVVQTPYEVPEEVSRALEEIARVQESIADRQKHLNQIAKRVEAASSGVKADVGRIASDLRGTADALADRAERCGEAADLIDRAAAEMGERGASAMSGLGLAAASAADKVSSAAEEGTARVGRAVALGAAAIAVLSVFGGALAMIGALWTFSTFPAVKAFVLAHQFAAVLIFMAAVAALAVGCSAIPRLRRRGRW